MMMFTIPRHGVLNEPSDPRFSHAQYRLLHDPAAIRLCGAPTGAGKTYAFQQAARQGQLIFFVVPTQALAKDIHMAMTQPNDGASAVPAEIWDANQTQAALAQGVLPWAERKEDMDRMAHSGGMIIATLEALANLTLGKPARDYVQLDMLDVLWKAKHLVFDESHTLTHRAFGLLHLWATVIAFRHQQNLGGPRLSLLSATPSNLFAPLLEADYLPKEQIAIFDEEISEAPDRPIHGDVEIHIQDATLLETAQQEVPGLLAGQGRVLLIYDSLAQMIRDGRALCRLLVNECGLRPDEIIFINGQDRQTDKTLDNCGFDAGLTPMDRHRVIVGTSAVEMGVNFAVDALISDPGLDAAALLQRIGRIARGDRRGKIYLTCSEKSRPSHFEQLGKLSGQIRIPQLREQLQPLRSFNSRLAKALGSAYWSMLERTNRNLMHGVRDVFAKLTGGNLKVPGGFLNKLHVIADQQDWRDKRHYLAWLKAVDKSLQDVRGFSPTIRLRFKGMPENASISYQADWVARHLRSADRLEGNVYCYDDTRDDCLRQKAIPIPLTLISPLGEIDLKAWTMKEAADRYIDILDRQPPSVRRQPGFQEALAFIQATRLLARDAQYSGQQLIDSDMV